jgi:Gluconate 2-dehydrogenase subunit 3
MGDAARWLNARVTRRQFVEGAAVVTSAVLFARATRWARALDLPAPQGFLGEDELRVVEAFTARLVPADDSPGAREAGVVDYIQGLLSAFPGADANADGRTSAADVTAVIGALGSADPNADVDGSGLVDAADVSLTRSSIFGTVLAGPPAFAGRPLFAGGPFSGRTPFPDPATGTPSDRFPPNSFASPLPLPRVKRLAWTVRLLGAAAVPEVADNPLATTRLDVDMRHRYREGIAQVNALSQAQFGAAFDELDSTDQDALIKDIKRQQRRFYDLLVDHTIEGLLCAPEYGGNRDTVGWTLSGFDGDSQPLGYSIYDATIDDYRERTDKPLSTILPGDCAGLSADMLEYLRFVLVTLAQAKEFDDPFCFMG